MKQEEILKAIKEMNIVELNDLVKAIEEEFGVSAVAPVAVAAGGAAVEESNEVDVTLESVTNKLPVIKVVRELTGLGLKEAKDLVESAPVKIKEGIDKTSAEEVKEKLEAAGSVVKIG